MNFLQNKTDLLKKVIFALVITSCFALVAMGQNPPAQQQGKMYGDPGFVGEPINLKVVNADIRDILNIDRHRNRSHGIINHEIDSVLLSDVVQNVAHVGVDDIEIDRLADKSRLAIALALARLHRHVVFERVARGHCRIRRRSRQRHDT